MKNITLILCFFCFSSVSTAQLNETIKSWERVSAGAEQICALGDGSVKCWGWNTDVPKLKNPREVSAGGNGHSCALDDEGVKCWGRNDYGQTDVPKLKNPRQVSAGGYRSCALDDEGAKCWGYGSDVSISNLKNPRQVSVGVTTACALDDEGVKCWWADSAFAGLVDSKNPRQVSVGEETACALDDEGVTCWAVYFGGNKRWVVTDLKNPRQVSTAFENVCVIDNEGVKCWGDYKGPRLLPVYKSYTFESFSKYLNLAIESSVYSKSTFLKPLEKFHTPKEILDRWNINKLFLLASIVSPVVLGTNSDYFKADVIPRLNAFVTALKIWTLFPLDQDPIPKVGDDWENRTLALTAIQSSLDVSLIFLSGKQIDRTQDALRKVGQAMIDPRIDQNILEALNSVESLKEERDVLLSSEKSKFLIECQQVAIDWLKLKVK